MPADRVLDTDSRRPGVTDLDVAILGGGIGGLATAAFLHRAGIRATVYEQASALTEVGAGLVVAPNAARVLRRLGVLGEFRRTAVQLDVGWEFRRWEDGEVLSAENLSDACVELYGEQTYTVHRADLLGVIRGAVPDSAIRLGHRCVDVRSSEAGVELEFADGQIRRHDLLVGADGIHSIVRRTFAEQSSPTFSGMCAFRALVPAADAPAFARRAAQTLWLGPGRHLVHYPVSAGRFINVVGFAPAGEDATESWSATVGIETLLAEFAGWDERLVSLLQAADRPGRWALLDRAPLSRWGTGRVTLLGDAAHPMFPFFAQGAAQALEDAAVLAACLADAPERPARALRRYESLRQPRTTEMQERSHGRAEVNHLPDGPAQRDRDATFTYGDPLVANGWIYGYDVDEAVAGAPV